MENRTMIVRVMALGVLLAMLLATLLSTASADAATTSGKAYDWGDNALGQLGNGTYGNETNAPGAVSNIQGVDRVKAGCDHSLALKNDGTVRAWGSNRDGRLGNGGTSDYSSVPVKVQIENVKAIAAGCDHNLALKENGTVWAWGDNLDGELGIGTSGDGTEKNVPVKVADIGTNAKGIAAGDDFSLALMKDGTVRAWGENTYGQLGNGASLPGASKTTPVRVTNLTNVRVIATDSYAVHALALKTDGTIRAWGNNYSGALGNGATLPGADKSTPVRVTTLTNVKAIATGGSHSLALMGSGRVKSWGYNKYGQLGNGTHGIGTNRSTPGNVSGLESVRSISGGAYQSFAVLESGRARSWGFNLTGQLGNGTNGDGTDKDVPVAIKNLTNVRNLDGGYGHTLAATQ